MAISKSIVAVCAAVFSCFSMVAFALAQDEALWPRPAQDVWETVNAEFVGPFDLDRDYTFEYTVPESMVETYTHSLEAAATDGKSRIFDVMSVAGSSQGSHFWTSTNMGHDDLDTAVPLTASERTAAGRCDVFDYDTRAGCGSIMNTGFDAEVMRGAVHSNTTMDPGVMDYHFSANGEAQVSARAAAATGCGDNEGLYSEQDYRQNITVAGDIQKFDYTVEFYGGGNSLCGPWN
ncbi:MAG: hypothetical protein SWQ30_03750 [Thermodesulfobacteriota bacterium]|nr:hypothetical protein [Thermodesulfobacteriota bacterium]